MRKEDYELQLSQRVHSQNAQYELCDRKSRSSDEAGTPRLKSAASVSFARAEGSLGTFSRIGSTKSSPWGDGRVTVTCSNIPRTGSGVEREMLNTDSHAPTVIYHV